MVQEESFITAYTDDELETVCGVPRQAPSGCHRTSRR